jgi:hypothetical protein
MSLGTRSRLFTLLLHLLIVIYMSTCKAGGPFATKTLLKKKGKMRSKSACLSSVLGDFAHLTGSTLIHFWRNCLTAELCLRRGKYFLRYPKQTVSLSVMEPVCHMLNVCTTSSLEKAGYRSIWWQLTQSRSCIALTRTKSFPPPLHPIPQKSMI